MLENLIGTLNQVDTNLFYMINLNLQNSVFNFLMPIITNAGTDAFWLIIFALIFVFGGEKGRNVAVIGIIALLLGYGITELLKYEIARPRPFTVLSNVHLLVNMGEYSFPSGHAVASFTGCIILGKKYGYLYPLLFFACIIAFSRVYIGVHYPFDVAAGAVIGVICSLLVLHFEVDILKLKNRFVHKS
ncbi:phosphatase PAP2 family protein [Methanobacterium paludis]|uniref:Phosphoesterase PA-phosphatase related protein n=1 Tax=Methanobacterium paludis (strain DSM 25820 / JCM 18151 / SWAN1) TaxID=868131 RepID=F6D7T0_METPW|nr:phosphatase PAP2 family protein [Methanobacterium paludis]AEG17768.1 phosphoesterase PA-phosphatase related protein [Methanobacterium paludis]